MSSMTRLASLIWGLPAALLLTAQAKPAFAIFVDCDAGGSIQRVLEDGETFLDVAGVCDEFVVILNDKTDIASASGNPADVVITRGVFAFGVQQVVLDGMTINRNLFVQDGADVSLFNITLAGAASIGNAASAAIFDSRVSGSGDFVVSGSASLFMVDSTIDDLSGSVFFSEGASARFNNTDVTNTGNGVFVGSNATLRFQNARMGPALVDDANLSCNPLCASDGALIRLGNVVIEGANNDPGIGGAISLSGNVSLRLRGDNVITNNGSQPAVGVFNDSSFRQDRSAGGTGASQINGDVQVFNMSYADFRAAVITGNVEADLRSVFRLGSTGFGGDPANTVLTGNSTISRDSAFAVEDPRVTVNGQITCLDRKSSVSGSFAGVVKFNNCTDFDGRKLADDDDD